MQGRVESVSENGYNNSLDSRNMFSSTSSSLSQIGNATGSPPMDSAPSSLARSTSSYTSRVSRSLIFLKLNMY